MSAHSLFALQGPFLTLMGNYLIGACIQAKLLQDPEAIKKIQATEREDHAKLFDAAGSHSITHIWKKKGLEVTVRRQRL